MEPLNDEQLNEILREWRAPEAPVHLDPWSRRQSCCRPLPWWKWLLTGSIPIPVPALAVLLIVLAAIYFTARKPQQPPTNSTGLANFQPVKQLNLRVIRSNYESH